MNMVFVLLHNGIVKTKFPWGTSKCKREESLCKRISAEIKEISTSLMENPITQTDL